MKHFFTSERDLHETRYICYKCKEYIRVFPNSHITKKQEDAFHVFHSGHPMQIVNNVEWEMIKEDYTRFRQIKKKLNYNENKK